MDYNNIQNLLDKYWEGETSVEEEKRLRVYFNQPNVPEKWATIQPMFQYFEHEKVIRIEQEDFEEQLLAQLDTTTIRPIRSRRNIRRILSYAAAVLLLVVGSYTTYQQFQPVPADDQYLSLNDLSDEDRLAYEQTKFALSFLASKLNKGTKIATDNVNKMNKAAKNGVKQ